MTIQRVLVVDDEPDIRELLRIFFEQRGFSVAIAVDGHSGVELARRQRPDVILMDILMPRKDGVTALHELRADSRLDRTTIIALTARPHIADELFRVGFDDVCGKPIDLEELWTMTTGRERER